MAGSPSAAETALTEVWLPGHDGINFYTQTYAAPAPQAVVLFMHGFAEHCGRYEWAHRVYASRGITVFAFDQRGYGLTALDSKHKSKESKYGKTSWKAHLVDIEWWLKHVKDQYPRLPIFLMGHSMGGALSLGFVTGTSTPPARESVQLVSGVIATSSTILLTHPPVSILRLLAKVLSQIVPSMLVPARVNPKALSHDKTIGEASAKDPLCPQKSSVKAVHDLMNNGEQLLWNDYKNWPSEIPLLIIHGTNDELSSHSAARQFYDKVWAQDKDFISVEDGYHDLVNELEDVKTRFVDDCISWILRHADATND